MAKRRSGCTKQNIKGSDGSNNDADAEEEDEHDDDGNEQNQQAVDPRKKTKMKKKRTESKSRLASIRGTTINTVPIGDRVADG